MTREIVIPGEVIKEGDNFLPGEGTEKQGNAIVSLRYGLAEESAGLIRVIPLGGTYTPRRGNVVIGKVEHVTFNGWVINIGLADNGFLPLSEVPRFIHKNDLDEFLTIGDFVVAKVSSANKKSIDLSVDFRGLGKMEGGLITEINPNKVPRVIGKEGSMIKLIKEETNSMITVGQNGSIWIKGEKIEDELLARKAITFIAQRSFMSGLTDEVKKWFTEGKK